MARRVQHVGAKLIKRAYIYAIDVPLTPNEFRLLNWMALTALDEDVTPRYFDSRESSALALGRRVVDDGYGDEADQRYRAAAFEAVKVAYRGLVNLRAITRIKAGRNGQRTEYAIHLDVLITRTTEEFARRSSKEGRTFPQRKVEPSAKGRSDLPVGEGSTFTQGTRRNHRGTTAGTTSPNASTSPAPVENFR
jgi:hypothetical protein